MQGQNGDGRRDVIANVFRGVQNRMISGYLLRDVVNLIDGIHFNAADEMHTLGHLYESMLREMRDTAGDSGEFYTPRPVVRFMVEVTDPRLGEVVLDLACGTGGFLSESCGHLEKQCKTVEDMKVLQEKSIFGGEAKPLPYMLAQMNLLLHGLKSPQIAYGNSLAGKLLEIGKRDRVDVVLTNPPFGGEEEAGIRTNFPADKQTSETALLFLQLIMRGSSAAPARILAGEAINSPLPPGEGQGGGGAAAHLGEGQAINSLLPPGKARQFNSPLPPGEGQGVRAFAFRPRRGRCSQRHALRRRSLRPHQARALDRIQPPHDRSPAQRRLCPLHVDPHEPAFLRLLRADEDDLVL